MDNQDNEKSNFKISENARKAKLNFLNTNITPKYTNIWETIVIEETINDGENIFLKERIPFNLNNTIDYERPSTTNDQIHETSRSINDEFPSSTKSLSPKNLKKAAVLNDNSFKLKMKNRNLNDAVNSDNKLIHKMNNSYYNDYDKFKNINQPLSPSEVQLEKWKEIKRFKNQFCKNNNFENSKIEQHQVEQSSFNPQTSTTPEEFIRNNSSENLLSISSFDHSIDQLVIDNSDYYASLDETTNYTTDQEKDTDDKLDDHLVNFENHQTNLLNVHNLNDSVNDNQKENQSEDQINNQKQANEFIKVNYTPRSSIISDEINEHNFIDNDDNQFNENYLNPYDYEQYLLDNNQINDNLPNIQINNLEKSNNQSNLNNNQSNIKIDEEFNKILLNYPNIEKFVNNLDSLNNSPIDSNQNFTENKLKKNISDNKLNDYKSSLYQQEELKIPNQVLEIEEPLIQTRNKPKELNQFIKRRSVIVQTSRPASLQTTNDDNDEIQHLLTFYNKKNQLTHYAPIKDVYIINRTVYQIQKLSSFILEFRSLLDLIRNKLKRKKIFSMEDNQEQKNNKSKDKLSNLKSILKWLIANLFSTPGLCIVLIFYCLIGAFLFEILEQENNQKEIKKMISYRNETVYRLIDVNLNKTLSKIERINLTNSILTEFEEKIILKVDMNGYSGNIPEKWSFSDSFLYSVTVISTIGYGKLSPKTFWGQLSTIIFALIGIPIMLLFITNLGTILASLFRVSYDTICCYICNFNNKDKQSNQDDTNTHQPVTVSEQLTDAKSIELTENKRTQSPQQQNTGDKYNENPRPLQDHETEDSIVVFQNNEYHTNVKERAYYLTYNSEPINRNRVPIRVVILIVFIYVCLGGLVFSFWESNNRKSQDFFKWTYFCFITLSTIGLGDIVPGDSFELRQDLEGSAQILFCVVYLIFGLALIAMSFNLVQEEVIIKMRKICENLGIDYRKRTLTY